MGVCKPAGGIKNKNIENQDYRFMKKTASLTSVLSF